MFFSWSSFKILFLYLVFSSLTMMCLGMGFVFFCLRNLFCFCLVWFQSCMSFSELPWSFVIFGKFQPLALQIFLLLHSLSLFLLLVGKFKQTEFAHVSCPLGGEELSIFRFQVTCLASNLSLWWIQEKLWFCYLSFIFFFIVRVGEAPFPALCILGGNRTLNHFR